MVPDMVICLTLRNTTCVLEGVVFLITVNIERGEELVALLLCSLMESRGGVEPCG